MKKLNTETVVSELGQCHFCTAKAFADTRLIGGWAYVCKYHFNLFGCSLGLGRGQILKVGASC